MKNILFKYLTFRPVIKYFYYLIFFMMVFLFAMVAKDAFDVDVYLFGKTTIKHKWWFNRLSNLPTNESEDSDTKFETKCVSNYFNQTLLIIAFGATSEYESIPLFEMLYKKAFLNRIYCGSVPLNNQTEINVKVVDTKHGAFLYDCLTEVMKTHTNFTGYLFIGEEILLNYWNMIEFDLGRIWEDENTIVGPNLYEQTFNLWEWWESPWGVRAVEKVYEYLIELNYYENRRSKLTQGNWIPDWDAGQALNAWLWNGSGEFSCYWTNKSVLYLPRTFSDLFLNISKHFRHSGVRHGIAIPTLIRLMTLQENNIKLTSTEVNQKNSDDFLKNRDVLTKASQQTHIISINCERKERRFILNDLRLKEYVVGKFLEYSQC
ncbi:uncharacterized protein LOC100205841 [Hydra vulgaris]|uniref:uncharacterized protein LOC100205841 n=1 Tax=Hydra vulgaris TaxID=6087 RepID=UPI00019244F2|nr:uncharacterized protein LOC100205841 [Hydra vulgaris]